MKKIFIFGMFGFLTGCGLFNVQSPRPNSGQLDAARNISKESVPVIVSAQTNKQDDIKEIARLALESIGSKTTEYQVAGVTNIVANSVTGVLNADGTAKILAQNNGKTMNDILHMSATEYLAYTAAQGVVASNNREMAMEGIKKAGSWIYDNMGLFIGMATGGTGLIGLTGLFAKKASTNAKVAKVRSQLLKADGRVLARHIQTNPQLKNDLMSEHTQIAVDAKKEHGLV